MVFFIADWIRRIKNFPELFKHYEAILNSNMSRLRDGYEYIWTLPEADNKILILICNDVKEELLKDGYKNIKIILVGKNCKQNIVIQNLKY